MSTAETNRAETDGRKTGDMKAGAHPAEPRLSLLARFNKMREAGLIVIIAALFVIMSFASPYFLTVANMKALMLSFSIEGIVVVGMTILLIVGGIDLSVGAVVCFAMVVAGKLFLLGVDPWTASLGGIAAAAMCGVIMGACVTRIGLNHFIASLAMMVIVRGACLVITEGTPLSLFSLPKEFKFVGQGSLGQVPVVILIFLAIVVVFDLLMRRAVAFRRVFYTGSNPKAADYSGIRTSRVIFWVTVLSSALAGLAGVIFMARFGAATPTFGVGMELNVIAAAVIGGASLKGGSGSVLGAVLGVALLSLVTNSLILLDVSVYWQDMVKGLILLVAVSVDHMLNRRRA
ncbi:ABC transporter permease [Tistrella mobilis]|uniref:Inner-membrane translocator n=2 Tax=Geminicoccaceae TaxID=2066434 RepID=I3TK42_TISMK|nr:inner-membrane translocator [Tistrella mobilis KA081020-065]MAM75532.1 ABC transporter permease [Tistrella sp.]